MEISELTRILAEHERWLKTEAGNHRADLSRADLSGADLSDANLRFADLWGANLNGANLSDANLRFADLRIADLRGADLRIADLVSADLRGADLSDANLMGANLMGARLEIARLLGAIFNWQSPDLIAEVLRRAAGDDPERRKIAELVLVSQDWCWDKFLELFANDPLANWALDELTRYVREGDEAPIYLTERRNSSVPGESMIS